jgi:hypothetical protein
MPAPYRIGRRALLGALAAMPLAGASQRALAAAARPKVKVTKDPNCGCCSGWVDHLRQSGFPVEVVERSDLNRLKARLGVPQALASCHTAEVGPYVIEGHVPADAVAQLLAETPQARGLAVPGMPVGSPGMEVPGSPEDTYEVVLFGPAGQRTFARYRGSRRL